MYRYSPSTFSRAQGVLRRNLRLEGTLGSTLKLRTSMRLPSSSQPKNATSSVTMVSSVTPCSGFFGCSTTIRDDSAFGCYTRRMTIQWFPGHMATARREAVETMRKTDVVIEVLDARVPGSSRNPMIEELRRENQRAALKVLNK